MNRKVTLVRAMTYDVEIGDEHLEQFMDDKSIIEKVTQLVGDDVATRNAGDMGNDIQVSLDDKSLRITDAWVEK